MRTLSRSSSSVQMMPNRLGSASGREGKLHRWKCRLASFVDSDADDEEDAEDEEEGEEEAVDKTGEKPFSPGHSPGLEHVERGAELVPLRGKSEEAKALAAIAGIALLNVGAGAKWAARGVVQVTVTHHRTPPANRRLIYAASAGSAGEVGGSYGAGAFASAEGVVEAAFVAFEPPLLSPRLSALEPPRGKQAATETSGSVNSLSVPGLSRLTSRPGRILFLL